MIKCWLSIFLIISLFIQCKKDANKDIEADIEVSFPESWIGTWEGPLIINSGKLPYDTIVMNFKVDTISGTDSIIWQLQYGEQSMRDYRLIQKKDSYNEFILDEQNSIFIDAKLFDQKLISFFEVQNNALTAVYEFVNGKINFEIMMYNNKENVNITGNSIHNGEEIPEVKSYLPIVYQKAILIKSQIPNKLFDFGLKFALHT